MSRAVQIIARAAEEWPEKFPQWLNAEAERDHSYALSHAPGAVRSSIVARARAARRAAHYVTTGELAGFDCDMSAGIIALNRACTLLMLSRAERTAAAVEAWGDL